MTESTDRDEASAAADADERDVAAAPAEARAAAGEPRTVEVEAAVGDGSDEDSSAEDTSDGHEGDPSKGDAGQAETSTSDDGEPAVRALTIKWIGPFHYRRAIGMGVLDVGLYLVTVGQEPLFVGASDRITREMAEHVVYEGGRVYAGDMLGRDLLSFTETYRARLQVKLAGVWDDATQTRVEDLQTLQDAAALIAFRRPMPCNPYDRARYAGSQSLEIRNVGKKHPFEESYRAIADN